MGVIIGFTRRGTQTAAFGIALRIRPAAIAVSFHRLPPQLGVTLFLCALRREHEGRRHTVEQQRLERGLTRRPNRDDALDPVATEHAKHFFITIRKEALQDTDIPGPAVLIEYKRGDHTPFATKA